MAHTFKISINIACVSKKGKDLNGEKLTEDSKLTERVEFNKSLYHYGNRYKDSIELYQDHKLKKIVSLSDIRLVKI